MVAVTVKPAGASVTPSKWLIHTSCSAGASSGRSSDGPVRVIRARPYSPCMPTADDTAELLADQLGAVADAEHGNAEFVDRRIERWCPVDVDALGASRQDDRRRLAVGDLVGGDPMRDDLGVHLQLAHPTGDQLGVLGAEVDDENGGPVGVDVVMLRLTQGCES